MKKVNVFDLSKNMIPIGLFRQQYIERYNNMVINYNENGNNEFTVEFLKELLTDTYFYNPANPTNEQTDAVNYVAERINEKNNRPVDIDWLPKFRYAVFDDNGIYWQFIDKPTFSNGTFTGEEPYTVRGRRFTNPVIIERYPEPKEIKWPEDERYRFSALTKSGQRKFFMHEPFLKFSDFLGYEVWVTEPPQEILFGEFTDCADWKDSKVARPKPVDLFANLQWPQDHAYKWFALDKNGEGYFYFYEPKFSSVDSVWTHKNNLYQKYIGFKPTTEQLKDYRNSLRSRPKGK